MIGERIDLPPDVAFEEPRGLPERWRCSDYGGWAGTATVRFPSRAAGLTIAADPVFKHLMVYATPQLPAFCLEPQTNASCAFDRAGGFDDPEEGVIILEPGESASGTIRFGGFRISPPPTGAGMFGARCRLLMGVDSRIVRLHVAASCVSRCRPPRPPASAARRLRRSRRPRRPPAPTRPRSPAATTARARRRRSRCDR